MIRNLLKHSTNFLTQQQTSILSAAFVIMAMSMVAKLLGLVKLRLLIHYFGDGTTTAIFLSANKLPEILFDMLIFAILSVSFIPLYTGFTAQGKSESASRLASAAINLTLLLYAVLAVVVILFAAPLSYLLAPGLVMGSPENLSLMVALLRLTMVAQFFLIIGGYFTAILQSHQRFLVPAIATTLYNICVILGLYFLAPRIGVFSAVIGMIVGGFMLFVFQLPFLKKTPFIYLWLVSPKTEGVMKMFSLSIPRMLGNMSATLVENLHIILASLLGALAIISLEYATRLAIVPVSLFGVSIAQAALPSLTIAWSQHNKDEFSRLFVSAFNQILFFALPVAAIFIILRLPIVRLLFGDQNFTWEATVTTGRTLAILGFGVVAQSAIMLFARSFYAMHDTKTPLKVSMATLTLDAVLALVFVIVFKWPIWSLAAVYSFTTIINAFLLLWLLTRRLHKITFFSVLLSPAKLVICTLCMMFVMYIPFRVMDLYVWEQIHNVGRYQLPPNLQVFILDTRYTANLMILTATAAGIGSLVYVGLATLLKVEEVTIVSQALRKLGSVKRILSENEEVFETDNRL